MNMELFEKAIKNIPKSYILFKKSERPPKITTMEQASERYAEYISWYLPELVYGDEIPQYCRKICEELVPCFCSPSKQRSNAIGSAACLCLSMGEHMEMTKDERVKALFYYVAPILLFLIEDELDFLIKK